MILASWKRPCVRKVPEQSCLPNSKVWFSHPWNKEELPFQVLCLYLCYLYFWEMKLMKKESALFKRDYFEYNFLLGGTPTIFLCYGAPKNPRLDMYIMFVWQKQACLPTLLHPWGSTGHLRCSSKNEGSIENWTLLTYQRHSLDVLKWISVCAIGLNM